MSGRGQRLRAPALTFGALAAAALALRLHDPHQRGSWGFCPSALLGVACPGCGGLRAVNDLTHGDVGAAASSNLLLVAGAPFAVALLVLWTVARWRDRPMPRPPERTRRVSVWLLAGAALGFTVLRNTPAGAWLAP
ncbi:MAG TPA: DUF2752 domain-containing protein [Nocardioides sp.]|uniref:DUF2752 domain-containing protein n=1 Tax=Nocardioides sp. TaxID=35761 RepID=UPI002EDB6A55